MAKEEWSAINILALFLLTKHGTCNTFSAHGYLQIDREGPCMRCRMLIGLFAGMGALLVILHSPSAAVTDGPLRRSFERFYFSESIIRSSIYAARRFDVYNKEARAFVRGVGRQTEPLIYEPDVYTWELAMAAHRRQIFGEPRVMDPMPSLVAPQPMETPTMAPLGPGEVHLTPFGPGAVMSQPLPPADADARMQRMLTRAAGAGITPDSPLRAEQIKNQLIQHMNTIGQPEPEGTGVVGAPNIPLLPPRALPPGRAADSYDACFGEGPHR